MNFRWERKTDDHWVLRAPGINTEALSCISVRKAEDYWSIFVCESPTIGRYTSEQGAKLDAWEYAYSKRRFLFGAYSIRITKEHADVQANSQ